MPFELRCQVIDPLRHENINQVVDTYATQNDARWWAVAFCQRGSVPANQGLPNEDLIPIHNVWSLEIREVP